MIELPRRSSCRARNEDALVARQFCSLQQGKRAQSAWHIDLDDRFGKIGSESPDLRHRLLAILAADAVGYSAWRPRTTAARFRTSKRRESCFEQTAASGGRVIDTAGDSVLAVFDTAAGAVSAAMTVQQRLSSLAVDLSEDKRMRAFASASTLAMSSRRPMALCMATA
jgi:class 3 adenylate cyclase